MVDKDKILAGRVAVDAYRTAHNQLYVGVWHRDIPEEHAPLLETLVTALEGQGFTSTETDFEPKKDEILEKFWNDSNLLNVQELGFTDREDFMGRGSLVDRKELRLKWA
ncbi:hypothetical protein LCGC14_0263490 [marine sediment metagenome]|uniref:Uncharacterized protein n=1 Tax=marine sediment metagenome TaxID=412755 RepID=A0A0F9U640_9ZZZZ